MKKIVCTLIMAGVFLAGFLFCAIACKQEEMKAPYISLTGNVVSWSPIEGAECYQIYQDNQQVADTESNSYLLSIEKAGSYEIKVKAVFESGESEFSNTVLFVVEQKVLSAPLITLTENKVLWEKVENANRYAVYINENLAAETEELYYIIDVQEVGYYDIKVKALSDLSRFTDSPFSEEKEYAKTKELMSPEIFIEENVIRWGEIENADAYAVFVNGTQVLRTTELFYTFEGTEIGTFEITIKALSNNVLYLASKQSNSVSYTVNPIALQAPQLKLEEGILRWKNVANATQYEIYCDNEVVGRVVETEYIPDIMEAGTYVFSVKAISDSPKYLNSELSNEVNIVLSAPSTASAVLAGGQSFSQEYSLGDRKEVSFAIPLGKVNADDVRLHVFAKGNDAEFRITANTSSGKELVMDWTFVSQTILHQQRLYAGDATETVLDSTFTVGYEYFTCLLSDSMTSEDGSYHLILEMRSADNDASLSIVGVCAEKMSPAAMYAIETDRWAQYSELLTPFSGWLTLDYTQQGKGYQAVSKQFTMPSIEDYDTIKLRVKRGTGAGGPEGIMVYKISGYDFETGKNYVLKDWFVMAFRQGEQIYDLLLDAEASRALSQKNILLTIQAQPQELQPDGSAGASIGDKEGNIGYLVTGSFNVFEFALSGYKNPQQSAVFTDIVGGIYNADTVVQVKADTFIGELKLSGGTESIPSSAKQTVTVNQSNNIYVSFYAKAGNSDGITMPKTSFRLTVSLNGGEEVNLLAWHTIGGTSSRISDGNTDFGLVINDRYEWYCLSLDNYFLNSAGTLVFTMYQMNTQAQDAEELYITGFSVSPREANTPGTGGFDSAFSEAGHLLGGWIGSTDIHVGFGSWMEIFGSHDDSYPYYAIAKLLSVPELTDDASAYRFSTTVSNVGNADEMLLKMVAVDSTGNVYCLTDWTCIYCTNIDTPYAVEFDETTCEQISGKTLNVIIQFADTQNQGSNPGATDRLYLNGFALTQAEV